MVAIFYFLLIRPQRKKDKKVKDMLAALKTGDRVCTIGGIYGTITNEQLAQALKEQHGVEVDKRRIEPEEPIKSAGQVLCTVRLTAGVSTRMLVNVTVESK